MLEHPPFPLTFPSGTVQTLARGWILEEIPVVEDLNRIARGMSGDINPTLADLTDEVLFGEVWARDQLSPRDRSMITVAALVAGYRTNELKSHIGRALDNGVTEAELFELFTHLAFYAGWPCAVTATTIARGVLESRTS